MTSDLKSAADAAFSDAWEQYDSAVERLGAGDVRDACGKAWNATQGSYSGLCVGTRGEDPQNTNQISGWIRTVGRSTPGFEALPGLYAERVRFLHQEACYDGHIDNKDIPVLIYGTADYIRQAERLASS